jgi:DNA-binding CsgD family transcriptional regulator
MWGNAGHKAMQHPQERVMGTLTHREREVLVLLAAGRSTVEIADELSISLLTARNHIMHIMEKLGAHSRVQAVVTALQGGLLGDMRRYG